jgi:hypothetical protein
VTGYQPGYRNIGRSQRRRRLRVAGAAFGGAGLYVLAYLWGLLPSPLLLAVFVPLAVGFEWGLQAYTGFCVRLALLNRYDFTRGDGGDAGTVTEPDARRADQLQAAIITGAAVVFAAATTLAVVFLA